MMKKLLFSFLTLLLAFTLNAQQETNVNEEKTQAILKVTPTEYANQVKADMTVLYNLTADQATQVYEVALKTAQDMHEFDVAVKAGTESTDYVTKRDAILRYGEIHIERTLDKNQLGRYRKAKTLARKAELIEERQKAAKAFNESRQ